MPQLIVKVDNGYVLWSTISDSPESFIITAEQLTAHIRKEHGEHGVRALAARLERVEKKGTSSLVDQDADDTMWLNRAGLDETALTKEQLLSWLRSRSPTPPRGRPHRSWTYDMYMGGS